MTLLLLRVGVCFSVCGRLIRGEKIDYNDYDSWMRERETETDRQKKTHRERQRETERKTERARDRQTAMA